MNNNYNNYNRNNNYNNGNYRNNNYYNHNNGKYGNNNMNNNYNNNDYQNNYNYQKKSSGGSPIMGFLLFLVIGFIVVVFVNPGNILDKILKKDNESNVKIVSYTITFDACGGTVSPLDRTLFQDEEYGTLPIPIRSGYKFLGWYTQKDGGVEISSSMKATNDRTLYAHWTKSSSKQVQTLTLYFDANGGKVSPSNRTLNKGDHYGPLPSPIKDGYTFEGWYTERELGTKVDTTIVINEDVTIYAHWIQKETTKPPKVEKYTLTFDPSGGEVSPTSKTIEQGEPYGELPIPTREGFEFIGWYNKRLDGEMVSEETIINSDTIIYAHWNAKEGTLPEKTYTLVFDPNGGSVNPTSRTLTEGSPYGELPTPVRSGYSFDGWYNSKNGGKQVNENTLIANNTIIYAHWTKSSTTPPPTDKTYTITFDPNGGTVTPNNKVLKDGEEYGDLPTPKRSGYIFDGWYTTKDGGTKVGSDTIISNNITIYAHWTKDTSGDPTAESLCEKVKNNTSIDYLSFKELSKLNNNDDYYAIKAAHDCANKYNKPVVVTKGTYHIYKYNKEKSTNRVVISTDTDFGGSVFYIHDEKDVCSNGQLKYSDYIFEVKDTQESYTLSKPSDIKKGGTINIPSDVKTKIAKKLKEYNETVYGYHIDITDENTSRKIFIRSGANENEKNQSLVQESFKVDTNGKILNDVTWTYADSKNVTVSIRPISSRKMTIKNGVFRNIVSSAICKSSYVKRGMKISRSNILVSGIDHLYVYKDESAGKYKRIYKIKYAYHGFFAFSNLSDVNFKNSTVQGMRNDSKSSEKLKDAGYSTYDLHITHATDFTLNKVTMADHQIDDLIKPKDNQIWGVTGTSFVKDITYNNCVLNRIDTHRGVHNLTVNNSTLGIYSLTQIGFGTLTINNVTIKHANRFVKLRNDYGSTWNGDIVITGKNTIIPDDNDTVYLVTFGGEANHNYGYDLYLPNVTLKSDSTIIIKSNTTKFAVYNKSESYFEKFKVGGGYKLKNFKTGSKPTIKMSGTVKSNKGTLSKPHFS